jgi:hypothetical protein
VASKIYRLSTEGTLERGVSSGGVFTPIKHTIGDSVEPVPVPASDGRKREDTKPLRSRDEEEVANITWREESGRVFTSIRWLTSVSRDSRILNNFIRTHEENMMAGVSHSGENDRLMYCRQLYLLMSLLL